MMKKRILAAMMAVSVFFSTVCMEGNVSAAEEASENSGTTYYVSTLRGKDSNDGMSERNPFYSLRKINELDLKPGDQVLLECGSVFKNGYLHLYGQSGSAEAPIVIDQYGSGADPVIDTNGQGVWYQNYGYRLDNQSNATHKSKGYVSSSILLYDTEYIEIQNIEIVNKAPKLETAYNAADTMARTGVAAVAQDKGTIDHIYLKNLNIHDVIGNVYQKHMNNGGIYFTVYMPHDAEMGPATGPESDRKRDFLSSKTGIPRYNDVLIDSCNVTNTNRWGIAVGYSALWGKFQDVAISDEDINKYGSTNVRIQNNYVKDAGGDGITLMYCDRPIVQYNVSDGIGRQMHTGDYLPSVDGGQRFSAGIWPWKCKDAVFQYNEAFDTQNIKGENGDGQAWDADWGDGTIYQYNYSHNNGGGCLMVCLGEAYRTTFRYNISQNDLNGALCIFNSPMTHLYNNVFYIEEGHSIYRSGKTGGEATLENNIFYYEGDEPKEENWTEGNNKTYSNNLFYNFANTPEDAAKIVVESGTKVFENAGSGPVKSSGAVRLHEDPTVRSIFDGYKLAKDSPAIGKGKVITDMHEMDMCERDFFGNEISATEIPDIGAHKYQAEDAAVNPPAPQKGEVREVGSTTATITWQAVEELFGVTSYKITDGDKVLADVTDLNAVLDPETNTISVKLTNLEASKKYTLSVTAYDASGHASTPLTVTFTTAKAEDLAEAEKMLESAVNSAEDIIKDGQKDYTKDSWDELMAAYQEASKLGDNASKSEIEAVANRIKRAISMLQKVINTQQEKPVKLAAPAISDVKSVAKKDGIKVQVTLTKTDHASFYIIYRTVGGKTTVAGTVSDAVFLDSTLYGGKQVTYSAQAVSGDVTKYTDSDKGASKAIKIAKAPTKLKVKQKSGKAVISWKKVKKVKSYIVYRSDKKNGTYKKVATVKKNKTSYTDKKVKKKKMYFYKVAAKVGQSYTAMTSVKKIKIK